MSAGRLACHHGESNQERLMNPSHFPERVSEALIRATRQHDIHRVAAEIVEPCGASARPFSIAMSREAGTRGPAVARAVADKLGWKVYDNELLELVARD